MSDSCPESMGCFVVVIDQFPTAIPLLCPALAALLSLIFVGGGTNLKTEERRSSPLDHDLPSRVQWHHRNQYKLKLAMST